MKIWKGIVIAVVLTAAHIVASITCISKASFLYAEEATTRKWQIAFEILSFPFVYLERLQYHGPVPKFLDFDWFPALVVVNSLFWGIVLTALVAWSVTRKEKQKKDRLL